MLLKIGKMTQKELAEWFQISPSHMRKEETKKRYFPILAQYADYHFEIGRSGGQTLVIDFVYITEYQKPESPFNFILKHFDEFWSPTHLDTMRNVAKRFMKAHPEWTISLETCITYVGRAKVILYGHNYLPDHGEKGSSKFEWAQLNLDTRFFEELPIEHQEILSQISARVYAGLAEEIAKLVCANVSGQLSTEELEDGIRAQVREKKMERYEQFLSEVQAALGYIPDCVTKLEQERDFT